MADNDNPFEDEINFEAEGDFGETKFDESTFPKEQKPATPGKGPLVFAGLVAVVLIWQLSSFFMGDDDETDMTPVAQIPVSDMPGNAMVDPAPMTDDMMTDESMTEDVVEAPVVASERNTSAARREKPEVSKQSMRKLENQVNAMNQRLDRIETLLRQGQSNDNAASRSVSLLSNQMTDVSESVDRLEQQMQSLTKPPEQKARDATQMSVQERNNPTWRVHAIIPGRAWLKNTNGETVTIIEGDKLELYGTVIAIDAGQGTVVTSSGIILR